MTQGGILHTRTNFFALDCREAEDIPSGYTPSSYMPPNKLIILTDGTCGSTCATFTKIPQEAGENNLDLIVYFHKKNERKKCRQNH